MRLCLSLNPDVKHLGSARASDVPLLDPTVRVGTRLMNEFPLAPSSTLQSTEPNVRKRQATESIHVSEDDSDELFPHFLVVETTDSTPIKFFIFTI